MENQVKERPTKGIAVDGYCRGNPGPGGYRGIDIETGEILFKWNSLPGESCTNNLSEFLGVVHALGFVKQKSKKEGINYGTVYTDSEIAIAWVNKKEQGTKFDFSRFDDLKTRIRKSEMFLVETKSLPYFEKWDTKNWGEIPADFGNKKV